MTSPSRVTKDRLLFSSISALFHFTYALSPLLATLTKTEHLTRMRVLSERSEAKDLSAFFSIGYALYYFTYALSPLFATLTKTTGVYPFSSQFGTHSCFTPYCASTSCMTTMPTKWRRSARPTTGNTSSPLAPRRSSASTKG